MKLTRVWLSVCLIGGLVYAEPLTLPLDRLEILQAGYPRAFFFRNCEGIARSGRVPFEQWDQMFVRLGGIEGKVFDEEIPGTSGRNIDFFVRFKKHHPEQLVLIHYNGNARDPRDGIESYYAGHWLYYNGCKLTKDVPAQEGVSILEVEDPGFFGINIGRYRDKNEDLVICALTPEGKPDFSRAEQLELISKDEDKKTLRVRRGAFGTKPLVWKKNRSYIAAHATGGPWGKRSNLLWLYNYNLDGPRDPQGRTCVDVLVDDLASRFESGGDVELLDGIEFDVLQHFTYLYVSSRGVDVNADGKIDMDLGAVNNSYGLGVIEFCRRLQKRLGHKKLVLADGGSWPNQRAFGILNGIESEGWPNLHDMEMNIWSTGINRHRFWHTRSVDPVFHYVNHKYVKQVAGSPRAHILKSIPLDISRLVMSACHMMDAVFCSAVWPEPEADEKVGIYDELRMGTARRNNWLGQPLGPPVELALGSEDLLAGGGKAVEEGFLKRLYSSNAAFQRLEGRVLAVKISSTDSNANELQFTLADVQLPGEDAVLRVRVRAEPLPDCPATMAREMGVTCQPVGWLMLGNPQASGIQTNDGRDRDLDSGITGAMVRYFPQQVIGDRGLAAYFVHPPYKNKGIVGYTWWEQDIILPHDAILVFHTGVRPARGQTDGVTYRVDVREGSRSTTVFDQHQEQTKWIRRTVDLSAWSGRLVCLRFLVSAGPAGNGVADHACWGDVQVISAGQTIPDRRSFPKLVTWADGEWFEAGFYYRNFKPGRYSINFEIEGTAPVYLSNISLHGHPDVMLREFENGLVLANPSLEPFTFNLTELVPGKRFRRLKGSSNQDPQTNDGTNVAETVVVPSRDGLFLVKMD
ncbi:MAG: hypothetical protein ACYTF1_19130 [Planctomycetota bacterium]|jgi:hypothetical protein